MFELEGKVYDKVPETKACSGCAFYDKDADKQLPNCHKTPNCIGYIFVERKTPVPGASAWTNWTGGAQPVPDDCHVEYRLRTGVESTDRAGSLFWVHDGEDESYDIVAYRVVIPPKALPDGHEALTFHPLPDAGSKPTNPKDAIGIRKAPLSVLPMGVVAEMGVGLLEGASKYGRHNFRAVGVRGSVYFDATMRHLISWWEGEDIDPDSGMSHITKALCSLAVLRDAQMQEMCTDDRPPRSVAFYPDLNELSGQVIDRHKDKNPKHYTIEDTACTPVS